MRLHLPVLTLLLTVPVAVAVTTTTDITNLPPVVAAGSLTGLVGGTMTPSAGATAASTVTFTVTDGNGYQDIRWVNVTVRTPEGGVHRAATPAALVSGSLLSATYSSTFNMNFHDPAAVGASTYKVEVSAKDYAGATTVATSVATFNYAELAAMSAPTSLGLGAALTPGATTAAQALAFTNTGNVRLDAQISASALSHATLGATLPAGSMSWSMSSDMSSPTALSGTAATASGFDLDSGSSSSRSLYLTLTVPEASTQWVPQGAYSGTLTLGAVKG